MAITNVEARNELDDEVVGYVKLILLCWERVGIPDDYRQVSQILKDVYDESPRFRSIRFVTISS